MLYGDVPLTRSETLARLREAAGDGVAVLTVELDDPTGYGRIVRDGRAVKRASSSRRTPTRPSARFARSTPASWSLPTARLADWVARLRDDNAQREYYLTDVVALAVADGVSVRTAQPQAVAETLGVNS